MSRGIGALQRRILAALDEPGVFWPEGAPRDAPPHLRDPEGCERGHRALTAADAADRVHGRDDDPERTEVEQVRRALESLRRRGLVDRRAATDRAGEKGSRVWLYFSLEARGRWPRVWAFRGYRVHDEGAVP